MFIFRILKDGPWDQFYLLWALSLRAVREQWRRICLTQTNREDCGNRYRERILPKPKGKAWAQGKSKAFRDYFLSLEAAKTAFIAAVTGGEFDYIASVAALKGVGIQPEEDTDPREEE